MSNPYYKAQRSAFKDARQTPVSEAPIVRSKSKKNRPFLVEYRWPYASENWIKQGAYRTKVIADKVIHEQQRKNPEFEYRHRS